MFFEDDENKVLDEIVEEENEENPAETPQNNELEAGIVAGLEDAPLVETVKSSFLDYAMSVIVSRAIPDARDGFKPVHRRVVYSMNESGMQPDKPFKKCARIVGDVMGKYHPHGDSAIYQTLVRLAQPFSMRYTLVDGHGNFGSVDGDEAAAMRYTEARMTKLSLEMVRDINSDVVDFVDNYDGTEREPVVLPSRFPNLLVNGSSGIAVGMATNIPPHNLGEVIDGVVAVARNPEITPFELMEYIKGPDFPTGGIILGKGGIKDAYETGTGSIAIRSRCHIEERGEHGLKRIVVTEIPYQVNKASMIEHIAELVRDKRIEGITDIRDESNKEGIRVVIDVRRDVIPEVLLNHLYKLTSLQSSYGIIMLCLVENAPKIAPLNVMLNSYLDFQVEVIERRTKFLLAKDEARVHIVLGLLKCHDNIDEIINIIKDSSTPEEASNTLIAKFGFSEQQTQAILAMTLRRLTGIETQKLEAERDQLYASIANYKHILESRENEIEVVIKELLEIKEKFGDERRTSIGYDEEEIDLEDMIKRETTVIAMTKLGYIKRMTVNNFKSQHRGGKGIKGMQTLEEDYIEDLVMTTTHHYVLFFTNKGRVYRLKAYEIPESSRTTRGTAIINLLQLQPDENITALITLKDYKGGKYLFMTTKNGLVKKTDISEYQNIRKSGITGINLREGDELIEVKATDNKHDVILVTKHGMCIRFKETDVRCTGRNSMGVIGMNLSEGDEVVGMQLDTQGKDLLIVSENGMGKRTSLDEFTPQHRGGKGVKCYKILEKTGNVIGFKAVNDENEIMLITTQGIIIRLEVNKISELGRITSGVKLINMENDISVASIAKVKENASEKELKEMEENLENEEE